MNESIKNDKVDAFIERLDQWQDAFKVLRNIINQTELTEDYKWMHPCYTLDNKHVVLIQDFTHYCALLFEKGAIMKDPYHTLIQQMKNVQAARQLRSESSDEMVRRKEEMAWHVEEGIRVEKSGGEAPMKTTGECEMPEEWKKK